MKELTKIYYDALNIVQTSCGDVVGDITSVKTNDRAISRLGLCYHNAKDDTYQLEISSRLLEDDISYDNALSTMVHEILHSCKNAKGHGAVWKSYAAKVMKKYPEIRITRTVSYEQLGIEFPKERKKYAVMCVNCKGIHYSSRLSNVIKHPENYHCSKCKGALKRIYEGEQISLFS